MLCIKDGYLIVCVLHSKEGASSAPIPDRTSARISTPEEEEERLTSNGGERDKNEDDDDDDGMLGEKHALKNPNNIMQLFLEDCSSLLSISAFCGANSTAAKKNRRTDREIPKSANSIPNRTVPKPDFAALLRRAETLTALWAETEDQKKEVKNKENMPCDVNTLFALHSAGYMLGTQQHALM